MAQRVEELKIWQRAKAFAVAVYAILDRPAFQRDRHLLDQIRRASDSIAANVAEGFAQPTDRAFARFLFIAKASLAEARALLEIACTRGYITRAECSACDEIGDEAARIATGLIKYLVKSNRKDRGLGRPQEQTKHS
jgi:four helix bundle protein